MVLTLSQISGKDWSRSDKWDVRFKTGDGPEGYTDWLPATDLTIPIANITSFDFASGHRTLTIPKALDYPDITMTLIDDENRTIKKFLRQWAMETFPNDSGVKYLTDIVKTLEVMPLTLQNEVVEHERYIVFLHGSLASVYSSTDSVMSYPISLKIVGVDIQS